MNGLCPYGPGGQALVAAYHIFVSASNGLAVNRDTDNSPRRLLSWIRGLQTGKQAFLNMLLQVQQGMVIWWKGDVEGS
jgi:hypothetical protein